jgi:ribosomal protection tetracycline resistance protein
VLRRTLNLGILAHVDAGKTTLTERLLHAAGVIDEVGSVDKGTTQTDSLALERERGITIKSAVVSFTTGDVGVNLIDTPGHPEFIAEVERALRVLDGAVLVLSAVEGVQAQTPLLLRALQRLHVPTLLFVNKIDRRGADPERVLRAISERLTPAIVAMGSVRTSGTPTAAFVPYGPGDPGFVASLVELDERLLAAYVADERSVSAARLHAVLSARSRRGLVHPVFFGSASTGAGVGSLLAGIAELLPAAEGAVDGPVSGTAFKIERGDGGEKLVYVRMFSGTVEVRDRLRFGEALERKVTAIDVFHEGKAVRRSSVSAGEIGRLYGLVEARIGDAIGAPRAALEHRFAPPTLESDVVPLDPAQGRALRVALAQLAEQDPLIDVRQDDGAHQISVSLYGEVQKEVIQAALASEYGIAVTFRETTPIYVERPVAVGDAVELLHAESNPCAATLGLRVTPAPIGSGVEFRLDVDVHSVPLYLFKRRADFAAAMRGHVRDALRAGPFGWEVTDCLVTLTRCEYGGADGPPSKRGPRAGATDFRKLTPLVLAQALERAGTVVCEPVLRASVELPADCLGTVLPVLARLGTIVETPSRRGRLVTIETVLPAARAHDVQQQLPALTGGEGVFESSFAGYEPVRGAAPSRGVPLVGTTAR